MEKIGAARRRGFVRYLLSNPTTAIYLTGPFALAAFWLVHRWGYVAVPVWVFFLIIAGGQVFSLLVNRIHDRRPTKGTLHLRVMTHAAITTAALYVTGW